MLGMRSWRPLQTKLSHQGRTCEICKSGKLSGTSPAVQGLVKENERPTITEQARDFAFRTSTTNDNGLSVQAVIGGQPVKMLVDSGASVTVINSHFMNKVKGDMRIPDAGIEMTTADGRAVPFEGRGDTKVRFGVTMNKQTLWFADITAEGILGCDFLEKWKCQIDFSRSGLVVDGCFLPCKGLSSPSRCCKVTLTETVVIPPLSAQFVRGKMEGALLETDVMLEPSNTWKGERKVIVDPVMVKSSGREFPVCLMNVSGDMVKLCKGMHLGQCEGVTEVQHYKDESQEDLCHVEKDGNKLPSHLEQMWCKSTTQLSKEEKRILTDLLNNHTDKNSHSKDDLGRTNVVNHKIDTGAALYPSGRELGDYQFISVGKKQRRSRTWQPEESLPLLRALGLRQLCGRRMAPPAFVLTSENWMM